MMLCLMLSYATLLGYRKELERLNDQDAEADTGGGVGMFETPGVLKEKVKCDICRIDP